jgi:threonyl-tRNA synthetase
MNCPGHVQVFNSDLRSYRDLPLRYGEFGACHRNESSGSLHGLLRVRGFTQDDGHIFCTEDQIQSEVDAFTRKLLAVYRDFGFHDVIYRLSTRPAQRVGSDESWDKAEKALAKALDAVGVQWQELKGEGAFYGPKIEYSLKDSLGRIWQCGTIQVDFNMPVRLGAEFVDADNTRKPPVMLHRAIVGSLERFIGILIENHAGAMPAWLAPVQAVVASITDAQADYAAAVCRQMQSVGLRVQADLRSEKISLKIRELSLQKVPFILVVGDKEKVSGQVTVRARGGQDLGAMGTDAFASRLEEIIKARQ